MALVNRHPERQTPLFIATGSRVPSPGHLFYERFSALFAEEGFDRFVEGQCARFFAGTISRPGNPPVVYFRILMVGYLEGIGSEREIAWRCADSRSLASFLQLQVGTVDLALHRDAGGQVAVEARIRGQRGAGLAARGERGISLRDHAASLTPEKPRYFALGLSSTSRTDLTRCASA